MPIEPPGRPLADDELLIERTFAAPAALVFDLWARREHMLQWMGPKDCPCIEADLDFRVDGEWSACVLMQAHGQARMGGRYLEIEPGRRIVMTFQWRDGSPDPESVITLTFTERDGKTVQTFHQAPFHTVERRDSHVGGWNSVFDKEQAYAEAKARENVR